MILAVCCMSLFVVGTDATIVNIALPSIQRAFGASVGGLQWTIDAYTLVLGSLLLSGATADRCCCPARPPTGAAVRRDRRPVLLSGATADRFGRRRVFQAGLGLYTAGSLLCSLAPGLGWLVAFRMLQAVGGSMLNPVAMAIIVNTFTEPAARARAAGVWGSVMGLSLAAGPVLGGVLVSGIGWRSILRSTFRLASRPSCWPSGSFPSPARRGRGGSIRWPRA